MNYSRFLFGTTLALGTLMGTCADAQISAQTQEQVQKLTRHLFSTFVLRNELRLDPGCRGRTYPDLDLGDYVKAVPRHLLPPSDAERMLVEFPKILDKLYAQTLPSGTRSGAVAYDTAVKQWMSADLPGAPTERCDRIFHVIRTGYGRLLEDTRALR